MAYISIEKLLNQNKKSLYKLVLSAAARANELTQGAQPLVPTSAKKFSMIALEEIAAGKVRYEEVKSKSKSVTV